jgi:hypothetical protein
MLTLPVVAPAGVLYVTGGRTQPNVVVSAVEVRACVQQPDCDAFFVDTMDCVMASTAHLVAPLHFCAVHPNDVLVLPSLHCEEHTCAQRNCARLAANPFLLLLMCEKYRVCA